MMLSEAVRVLTMGDKVHREDVGVALPANDIQSEM